MLDSLRRSSVETETLLLARRVAAVPTAFGPLASPGSLTCCDVGAPIGARPRSVPSDKAGLRGCKPIASVGIVGKVIGGVYERLATAK